MKRRLLRWSPMVSLLGIVLLSVLLRPNSVQNRSLLSRPRVHPPSLSTLVSDPPIELSKEHDVDVPVPPLASPEPVAIVEQRHQAEIMVLYTNAVIVHASPWADRPTVLDPACLPTPYAPLVTPDPVEN